jgi:hypothetical protein
MHRRLLVILLISVFLGSLSSSCIIHAPRHGHRKQAVKAKKCKPSHYWDGKKCRHKGKGKGARKHDY